MTRFARLSVAALAAALAVPGVVAAAGDDVVGTAAFESLTVTGGAGTIEVVGVSSFGGEELVVGGDDAGDGAIPGTGTDLVELRISQDPDSGDLSFSMETDLAAPATAPVLVWSFPFGGSSLSAPQLLAFASDPSGAPGTFHFGIGTGGGINEDFSVADVSGHVDGATLTWVVPTAALGVDPGGQITPSDAAFSTTGSRNAAFVVVGGTPIDDAIVSTRFGVGGGATVKILDAAGEIVDEGIAKVRRGEFSRSFEVDPGTYKVEVTTSYADASVTKAFTVKVT